jgi:lysophospholipase L1-like esterase
MKTMKKQLLFLLLFVSTIAFSQTTTTPVGSIKHNNELANNLTAATIVVRNSSNKMLEGISKSDLISQILLSVPPTNLSIANKTANTLDVLSSTGAGVTIPEATTTNAGLLINSDKILINTITANAVNTATNTGNIATNTAEIATKQSLFTGTLNLITKSLNPTTLVSSRLFDDGTYFGIGTVNAPTKDLTFGNQGNREIGVEESDNTSIGKDLIVRSGRAINFLWSSGFEYRSQPVTLNNVALDPTDGSMYAYGHSSSVYKKLPNTEIFVAQGGTGKPLYSAGSSTFAITSSGNWYIIANSILLKSTNKGVSWVNTTIPATHVAVTPTNDVYIINNGTTTGYISKQTNETGSWVVQTCPAVNRIDIHCDSSGNVYTIDSLNSKIEIQTNGTGSFIADSETIPGNLNSLIRKNGGDLMIIYNNATKYKTKVGNSGAWSAEFLTGASTYEPNVLISDAQSNLWIGGYASNTSIKLNNALGTANLSGGKLIFSAGTGKEQGQSRIEFKTGQKSTSVRGTDMQVETLRMTIDEDGLMRYPTDISSIATPLTVMPKSYVDAQITGGTTPNATATVAGKAKLYTTLGTNTDGSVDQNTLNTAIGANTTAIATKENTIATGLVTDFVSGTKTIRNLATDVLAVPLTGLSTSTPSTVLATDNLLVSSGKLQAQATINAANIATNTIVKTNSYDTRFVTGITSPYLKNNTAIGKLLGYDFSSGLTSWVQTGAASTFAQSGTNLSVSGGNNDFLNNYKYTGYQFSFNDPQIELTGLIPTVDGTTSLNGIGVGLKSTDGIIEIVARLDLSNTATRGKLLIYKIISGTSTLIVDSGANLLNYTTGTDILNLKVRRRKDGFVEAKVYNQTTGLSLEVTSATTITPTLSFRTQNAIIYHFGGSQLIATINILNMQKKNTLVGIFGDSILGTWGPQFANEASGDVSLHPGAGQSSTDLVNSLESIVNSGATYGILAIGMNDALANVTTTNYMINIRKIVNAMIEVGTIPVISYVTPTTNTTTNGVIQGYNSALLAEYGGTWVIVDGYSALSNDGTLTGTLNSIYNSGDGVHPNATAAFVINQAIQPALSNFVKFNSANTKSAVVFQKDYYGNQNYSATTNSAQRFVSNWNGTSTGANALLVQNGATVEVNNLSTGTVSNQRALNIASTNTGGGVINTMTGIQIQDLTGGINNFGIRGLVSSGANKYNLYISGTASNYFNGKVLIGSTTDNGVDKLQVNGSVTATGYYAATNTTTVALTSATLTSTYPTATIGFQVHALSITAGGMIYTKTSTGWAFVTAGNVL